jgi:hypothetical protein
LARAGGLRPTSHKPRWLRIFLIISESSINEIIRIGPEHFEHFIAKQLFKLIGIRQWANHEGDIVVKAAIGGQHMYMWIKILEITKTLDSNCRAGFGVFIKYGLRQI